MRDTASSNVVFSFKDSDGAPGFLRSRAGLSALSGIVSTSG
jgi:hypothetical protein